MDRYKNCKWGSCLECPLPKCALEGGVVVKRYEDIAEMHNHGMKITLIAMNVGVSKRTVYRALKRIRSKKEERI